MNQYCVDCGQEWTNRYLHWYLLGLFFAKMLLMGECDGKRLHQQRNWRITTIPAIRKRMCKRADVVKHARYWGFPLATKAEMRFPIIDAKGMEDSQEKMMWIGAIMFDQTLSMEGLNPSYIEAGRLIMLMSQKLHQLCLLPAWLPHLGVQLLCKYAQAWWNKRPRAFVARLPSWTNISHLKACLKMIFLFPR